MAWFSGWEWTIDQKSQPSRQARWEPPMAKRGVQPAEGHLPYAPTVPGSHRAGPGDPGGAPYGRTEYGRSRGRAVRAPGEGKGLNYSVVSTDH